MILQLTKILVFIIIYPTVFDVQIMTVSGYKY